MGQAISRGAGLPFLLIWIVCEAGVFWVEQGFSPAFEAAAWRLLAAEVYICGTGIKYRRAKAQLK